MVTRAGCDEGGFGRGLPCEFVMGSLGAGVLIAPGLPMAGGSHARCSRPGMPDEHSATHSGGATQHADVSLRLFHGVDWLGKVTSVVSWIAGAGAGVSIEFPSSMNDSLSSFFSL